jgi:hypothetical protein
LASERGLVVSNPIQISGNALKAKSGLDPQELRTALLFWDKLDYPENNLIAFGLQPDAQFLVDAGVLKRTRIQVVGGGAMEKAYAQAHVAAFKRLDASEPGVWSLATGENSFSFDDGDLQDDRGVLVKLHHALPVPDKDVPLEDILQFRERRRAELLALRHHLEDIYQRVIAAGDGDLALNSEIEKLEGAIADHIKTSKETGLRFRSVSLNASLNLYRGVAIAAGAFATGLPMVTALLAGAASAITIGPGTALTWGKTTGTPFRYVSAYHSEIF